MTYIQYILESYHYHKYIQYQYLPLYNNKYNIKTIYYT